MFNRLNTCNVQKPSTFYTLGITNHPECGVSATDATLYGCYYRPEDKDSRYAYIFRNSSADTSAYVTLLGGDGPFAGHDVTFRILPGSDAIIQVESGRHMFVSQHNELAAHVGELDTNGCIFFTTASASVSGMALRLPL